MQKKQYDVITEQGDFCVFAYNSLDALRIAFITCWFDGYDFIKIDGAMNYKLFSNEQLEGLLRRSNRILEIFSEVYYKDKNPQTKISIEEYAAYSIVAFNALYELRSRKIAELAEQSK